MATAKNITMDDLLAQEDVKQLTPSEVVDGTILSVRKHEVLVDLGPLGVGLVPRREIGFGKTLNEGDPVTASVVDTELDNGYALLSFVKQPRIVAGTKSSVSSRRAKSSRLRPMMPTVAVSSSNTKGCVGSYQCRN